jgi:glycolate oxidase iron-sulfur subunit
VDIRELTDTCVHCGFCLPACPTYQLWGTEADSPRGRIHLIRQVADGLAKPAEVAGHLDSCLGCLACVPACPSGVRYDEIIEHGRELVATARPVADRAVRAGLFALFPYPRRLAAVRGIRPPSWAAGDARGAGPDQRSTGSIPRQRSGIGATARAAAELAPPPTRRVPLPRRVAARGPRRAVVGLLTGCVQSAYFSPVTAATARVLAREGCDVLIPRGQGCCGALPLHAGRTAQARRLARRTIATFARAGVDAIVTDVAGCGSAMKEYARLLAEDPRWASRAARFAEAVRDVTELLCALGPVAPRRPLPWTVAYHDACHLGYGQGVTAQPRELLAGVPQLRVVEVPDGGTCCGSAGVYNLLQPQPAEELGDRKAQAILATGAELVVAGNPGCSLQIQAALRRAGSTLKVRHTVELLDAALRPAPADAA